MKKSWRHFQSDKESTDGLNTNWCLELIGKKKREEEKEEEEEEEEEC